MPPLTTPATAVLFMIAFFAVMMGVPLVAFWLGHYQFPHFLAVRHGSHKAHNLMLPE
jgi:hypothetical protein